MTEYAKCLRFATLFSAVSIRGEALKMTTRQLKIGAYEQNGFLFYRVRKHVGKMIPDYLSDAGNLMGVLRDSHDGGGVVRAAACCSLVAESGPEHDATFTSYLVARHQAPMMISAQLRRTSYTSGILNRANGSEGEINGIHGHQCSSHT